MTGERDGEVGSLRRAATSLARWLPQRSDYSGLGRNWPRDLLAGLTVAVVALPLALGFGVASGVGATAGLITAVVAGFVAAVFGGSNFQVSGPTGAMTVVLLPLVASHGVGAVAVVAVLAGLVVVGAAFAGLGRLVTLIPWPVIEGFTVGIALIIVLQQVPNAIGVQVVPSKNTVITAVDALAKIGVNSVPAIAFTVLTIVIMVVVPRVRRTLPASLIAVVIATVTVILTGVAVATVGQIPRSLPGPQWPAINTSVIHSLLGSVVAVAALAAIESLLSAKVADGMADGRPCNPDRELFGQGLANVASGLFGGMPATGAIARTAVNVRAGATTRLSAIVHSLVLLAIVFVAASVVGLIPLAALAGVLMVTAFRMVDFRAVRSIVRSTTSDRYVFILTAACTVIFDLVIAVEIGIVLAALVALRSLTRASGASEEALPDLRDHVDTEQEHDLMRQHIAVYRIDGALFFGAAQRFLVELTAISDVQVVVLRMSGVQMLDVSGANALREVVRDLDSRHVTVIFKGLQPEHERILDQLGVLEPEGEHRHSFTSLPQALQHASSHVGSSPSLD